MPERVVLIELRAVTKQLTTAFKKVEKRTKSLTSGFKKAGLAMAAAFSVGAVFVGVKKVIRSLRSTLDETTALIQTARGVGFAANEYRRLTFALEAVGVSAATAQSGIASLQKRLAQKPTKASRRMFAEMGLDRDALLRSRPDEQVGAFLQALRSGPDELLESRAQFGFGGSGRGFTKAIRQWEDLTQAASDYDKVVGRGLKQSDERAFLEAGRGVRNLQLAWRDLKVQIVADNAPALTKAINDLVTSGELSKLTGQALDLANAFVQVGKDVRFVVGQIKDIEVPDWLKTLISKSGPGRAVSVYGAILGSVRNARLSAGVSPALAGTNAQGSLTQVEVTQIINGVRDRDMAKRAGAEAGSAVREALAQ